MSSLSNRLLTATLWATRRKRAFTDPQRTRDAVAAQVLRPAPFAPPPRLDRRARLTTANLRGWRVYTVKPKRGNVGCRVLYLHGGAYIFDIIGLHWNFIAGLTRSGADVTVPIYPLAPAATAETTVATAIEIAADLIGGHGPPVILMGDSAGGGMSLAVAQGLQKRGLQPHRIVLISPWLDATASDPRLRAIVARDPMLDTPGLAEAGRIYAGTLDPADSRVSPINGELEGLAPITMFCGTHDILSVDARRLVEAAARHGVSVDYHESEESPHVYPLFRTREGAEARGVIASLLVGAGAATSAAS